LLFKISNQKTKTENGVFGKKRTKTNKKQTSNRGRIQSCTSKSQCRIHRRIAPGRNTSQENASVVLVKKLKVELAIELRKKLNEFALGRSGIVSSTAKSAESLVLVLYLNAVQVA
jgi:hypothetical protein